MHLKEVFSSIDSKRITRDFNIYEFPFLKKRDTEKGSAGDDYNLRSDTNKECLHRNLALFGLAVDLVARNGDCCLR